MDQMTSMEIRNYDPAYESPSLIHETLELLSLRLGSVRKVPLATRSSRLINFENGVLNTTDKQLLPHSPEYHFYDLVLPRLIMSSKATLWAKRHLKLSKAAGALAAFSMAPKRKQRELCSFYEVALEEPSTLLVCFRLAFGFPPGTGKSTIIKWLIMAASWALEP